MLQYTDVIKKEKNANYMQALLIFLQKEKTNVIFMHKTLDNLN